MMTDKIENVKEILRQIKKESVPISGGSGDKERYEMRNPSLLWELGSLIDEICEDKKKPEKERKTWVHENFWKIDESIWPGHRQSYNAYKFKYEFMDEERFSLIADLAGYKFKKQFRRKRMEYLLHVFSKRKPTASLAQQQELIEKLGERDLTHDEFLKIKQQVLGSAKSTFDDIEELFDSLFDQVKKALDDSSFRETLRKEIGPQLIKQISYALQLLKMRDKLKFTKAYSDSVKRELNKKSKSKSKIAIDLFHHFKSYLDDEEKRNLLLNTLTESDLSQLNTNLYAIETEDNFKNYNKSIEALKDVFKD